MQVDLAMYNGQASGGYSPTTADIVATEMQAISRDDNGLYLSDLILPATLPQESDLARNIIPTWPLQLDKWSQNLEHEFNRLAEAEALDRIKPEEYKRLEWLQAQRRRFLSPRAGSDVMCEYSMRQSLNKALSALGTYVKLLEISRN